MLSEAVNVKDKIDEIRRVGNIDLLSNAHKLVTYVVEDRQHILLQFAKQEGVAWAKHALTIAFKLEWFRSIRRVMWDFLYHYDRLRGAEGDRDTFYIQEKRINEHLDQFFSHFFISYTEYKDKLLQSQRELVEDLMVPVIPLTSTIGILPLIGTVDSYRMQTIQEKVLHQIYELKIHTLIIDLSGVVMMEKEILNSLEKVLDGMNMMGCKPIMTGIRPEIIQAMVDFGVTFDQKAETKGTLQKALEPFFKINGQTQ